MGRSVQRQCGIAAGGVVRGEAAVRGMTGGGYSSAFVFYLHMGMGKIRWSEKGDPIINRIKDRLNPFLPRYTFSARFGCSHSYLPQ